MRHDTPVNDLISVAGSQASLARLLGVRPYNVYDWKRAGRLPVHVILLVETSAALSPYFPEARRTLRPGTSDRDYARKRSRAAFLNGRRRQEAYEQSESYRAERIHRLTRMIKNAEKE